MLSDTEKAIDDKDLQQFLPGLLLKNGIALDYLAQKLGMRIASGEFINFRKLIVGLTASVLQENRDRLSPEAYQTTMDVLSSHTKAIASQQSS